jgi:hypothetical protein
MYGYLKKIQFKLKIRINNYLYHLRSSQGIFSGNILKEFEN